MIYFCLDFDNFLVVGLNWLFISRCNCFKSRNVVIGQRTRIHAVPLDKIEEIGVSINCHCKQDKVPENVICDIKGPDDDHSDLEFYKDNLDIVTGRKLTISAAHDVNTTLIMNDSLNKSLQQIESQKRRKSEESEQLKKRQKNL